MSLKLAIAAARSNPIIGLPKVAAVIRDRRHIVSIGLNSWQTHPLQARFGNHEEAIHLHAEIAAIVNARKSVKGMTMYVARIRGNGCIGIAKPCKGCQRALIKFGLKDVIWTLPDHEPTLGDIS